MTTRTLSRGALPLLFLSVLAPAASAWLGGPDERAVLIVDPSNAESMYVANYYMAARDIPDGNVLYMTPEAGSYPEFAAQNLEGFFGGLANKGIDDHVDFVVIPPGGSFHVPTQGFLYDPCWPAQRVSTPGAYATAHKSGRILAGNLDTRSLNQYGTWNNLGNYGVVPFEGATTYANGYPTAPGQGDQYFVAAMLGYTGMFGNTLDEILDMIDRSVGADGTRPAGTVYYMETSDTIRSRPRHVYFDQAIAELTAAGGVGSHLFTFLPAGRHDVLGVMSGFASINVQAADMTLLPGSFADHLTSFAANFDQAGQTKVAAWIKKGASGSAGTVEEPCAWAGKFPHPRMHVVYRKGLTLGEAWLRSTDFLPLQTMLYGDPLTRPFAWPLVVDVNAPSAPVQGLVSLNASAFATKPGRSVQSLELFVDGVLQQTIAPGQPFWLQTRFLADGWHELRVVAHDDDPARNSGRWVGELRVDNHGYAVDLTGTVPEGNLTKRFDFTAAASGAPVAELRLLHNGRVVAALDEGAGTFRVFGYNLGAGDVDVQAEALFLDGGAARSEPVRVEVHYATSDWPGVVPEAYDFMTTVDPDESFLLELPASFRDDPADATFTVLAGPEQATILAGGTKGYRILSPAPGASGVDTLVYRVTTPSGQSQPGTVAIFYADGSGVVPFGCGVNPSDSLRVLSGTPRIASNLTFGVDNPYATQSPGAVPVLLVSTTADASFPCGTLLDGYGMAGAGSAGELSIDLSEANLAHTQVGAPWSGPGSRAPVTVAIANQPALIGTKLFAQAFLWDGAETAGPRFGLTNALELTISY